MLHYDHGNETLSVAFYVEHQREPGAWVRESRRVDRVHMNSVVRLAVGPWIGTSFLAWHEGVQ